MKFNHKAATLWMGDLEPYMDERFVKEAFAAMSEKVIYVKIVKNRFTGTPFSPTSRAPFGYCFVEFENEETALRVLHRLNGKPIPNTTPPKRFKLNHSNSGQAYGREFSLFVGDLTPEVDDQALFKIFISRYPSCKSAKVVLDIGGRSRGYGFVRFADECDQQQALIQMQNFTGLGGKPVRVSLATPKTHVTTPQGTVDYNNYYQNYDQYQNYYSQWGDYSQYYYGYNNYGQTDAMQMTDPNMYQAMMQAYEAAYEVVDTSVEEHEIPIDIDEENCDFMEKNEEFYEALDNSRWLPQDGMDYTISDYK